MRYVVLIVMTSIILFVVVATMWIADAPRSASKQAAIPTPAATGDLDPMVRDLVQTRSSAVASDPDKACSWAALGWAFQGNGMPQQALECYQQAERLEPQEGRWPFYTALAKAELSDGEGALAAMARAAELRPEFGPAFWRRGIWLMDLGRLDEAQDLFSHASRLDLDSPVPLIGIAKIAIARGQDQEAVAWLSNLLSQQAEHPYAKYLLAEAHQRLGETHEAAIVRQGSISVEPIWHDDWEIEIAQSTTGYNSTLESAQRQMTAERWRLASDRLEKLRKYWPDDAAVLSAAARTSMELGRYEDALTAATSALQSPALPSAQKTELEELRARTLSRLSRWSEAESAFVSLTQSHAENGDLWLELANAQLKQGKRDAAAASLEQAMQRQPTQTALAKRIKEALAATPASP